jgi:VanZ family protein
MSFVNIIKGVFLIWIILVAVMSLTPTPDPTKDMSDRIVHFIVYFITTSLFYFAFIREGAGFIVVTAVFVFVYSTGLEVAQAFLPYRNFSIGDIISNVVGIAAFIAIITLIQPTRTH